jgi:hypothetical protein
MSARESLRRVRASIEPAGSFGIDRTGTIGDFFDIRVDTASIKRGVTILPDGSIVQRLHQRRMVKRGPKNVAVEIDAPLCSTGVAAEAATVVAQTSIAKIIEAMWGGYQGNAGSLVASGASTTGVTVTATQGARFLAGTLAWIETGVGTARYVPVPIKTRTTDDLVFPASVGFVPAVGAKVLNSQVLYPADLLPSAQTHLQFLAELEDRDLIYLALGCAGAPSISWDLGQLAKWKMTAAGAKWLHDDDIGTPQGGAALAAQTLDGSGPIPVTSGSAVLAPIGGTTRTLPTIDEVVLNPTTTYQPVPSHNGVETIAQFAMVRGDMPTLSMLVLADDESWDDVFEAETPYHFIGQAGNVGGAQLALYVGTMRLIAQPEEVGKNGLAWWRLTWGIFENENCGTASTALERAPFSVGLG